MPDWLTIYRAAHTSVGATKSSKNMVETYFVDGKIAAVLRRQLTVQVIVAAQASERVTTTVDQGERIYDKVLNISGDCTAVVGEGSSCD
jgi:hypothetical protein